MIAIAFSILLFSTLSKLIQASNCLSFSPDDQSKCVACVWNYFYNQTILSEKFLASACEPRQTAPLNLNMLILSSYSGTSTNCSECSSKSFVIQPDLFSALIYASNQCNSHVFCTFNIYLELSPAHNFFNPPNLRTDFFRRSNLNLTIQPLFCGILSTAIPCAASLEYLQIVLIKSSILKIFISGSVHIKNILWDGADMDYFYKEQSCWSSSKCCTESRINTIGDICSKKNKEISPESPLSLNFGLFNLELIIDNPLAPIPSLKIERCKFINLYVSGYGQGFTALIKSAGYSFFNISIISSRLENVFFLEGILDASLETDDLITDPIYQTFTAATLGKLFSESALKENSSFLIVRDFSVTNYNTYGVKTKVASTSNNALLFKLVRASFSSIVFDNVLFLNISNQTEKQMYLINIDYGKSDAGLYVTNIIATNSFSSVFLNISNCYNFRISNITISQWVFTSDNPVLRFQNILNMAVEGIFISSLLSSYLKSAFVLLSNCSRCSLTNFFFNKTVGVSLEISKSTWVNLKKVFLNDCQFRTYLFYSEASVFDLNDISIIGVTVLNQPTNIVFSIKSSPIFNISSLYMNSVSAQAILDYKDAQNVLMNRFLIENITGIRTVFLLTTTFYTTILTDITIQNSVLPRFSEFQTFLSYNQNMSFIRLKLINLTLPALNAEGFAILTNINFIMIDSIIENMKRVGMENAPPTALIWIRRGFFAVFQNCSFKAAGYTFIPRVIVAAFNYGFIFMISLTQYSLRNCVFESDETVSLNVGFLVSGLCPILEIINCKFSAYRKNPDFIYKGISIFYGSSIDIINNTFVNLSCTPYNINSHLLKTGPVTLMGEDSLSFIKNSKRLNMHNTSFENCDCKYGSAGALHFSNYHIVNMSNLLFQNCSAISGGSLEIISSTNITARNITVLFSFAGDAASISYDNIIFVNLTNYKEFFNVGKMSGSWRVTLTEIFCDLMQVFNSSSLTNGGFTVLYSSKLQIQRGKFNKTSAVQFGGTFHITQLSRLILSDSLIENVEALNGGFISGDDAIILMITNCVAEGAQAFLNGGFIYIDLVFRSYIENVVIRAGNANKNGIIYIKTSDEQSFHNISQVVCEANDAFLGSCVYFRSSSGLLLSGISVKECFGIAVVLRNDLPLKFSITNFTAINISKMDYLIEIDLMIADINGLVVRNCKFNKYVIYLKSTSANFKNLEYHNNSRSDSQTFYHLFTKNSNISIKAIRFTNIEKNLACVMKADSSFVTITDSIINGAFGLTAVLNFENTPVYLERIAFKRNFITCISILKADAFLKDLEFIENSGYSNESPSDISVKNKIYFGNSIIIEKVRSMIFAPGLVNEFNNFLSLTQINCSFIVAQLQTNLNDIYQASLITDVAHSLLQKNYFCGFSSLQGAASRISASTQFFSVIMIADSIFMNCTSQGGKGGALSFFNVGDIGIINCSFYGNQALVSENKEYNGISGTGGVGIIYCPALKSSKCLINLEGNSFEDNFASLFGPLFISNTLLEKHTTQLNKNNTATFQTHQCTSPRKRFYWFQSKLIMSL